MPAQIEIKPASLAPLAIAGRSFQSRLFVGTGKYASMELMRDALDASGAQVVTVAVRRERLFNEAGKSLLDFLDLSRFTILPNTAGCFSAPDAVRVARSLARAGDAVLLSPACSSYDMFTDYKQRGDEFVREVRSLAPRGAS